METPRPPDGGLYRSADNRRSSLDVILGLVPTICCRIDRLQMLGTSPSMTKERLADYVYKRRILQMEISVLHLVD
ncbi:hypothetical protein EFQ99_17130 [Rhizobium vallis]|uniref:Uncharacterized protein n=1 Tax=Rhizobium vallis TaxID=634290 RepID=A0A3S0QUJ2_9HYPH|nr:hypothetical protein EFQ99_17130 [Rhizobium vallis]